MIEVIPASQLKVGDILSTDGYEVQSARRLADGRISVEAWRDASGGLSKYAVLDPDFPCPIWRENGLDASDPKWSEPEFPSISDTEYEQLLDRRIQHRLATDGAYRNAENAQQQAERERVIEDEECQRLDRQLSEARARRSA